MNKYVEDKKKLLGTEEEPLDELTFEQLLECVKIDLEEGDKTKDLIFFDWP